MPEGRRLHINCDYLRLLELLLCVVCLCLVISLISSPPASVAWPWLMVVLIITFGGIGILCFLDILGRLVDEPFSVVMTMLLCEVGFLLFLACAIICFVLFGITNGGVVLLVLGILSFLTALLFLINALQMCAIARDTEYNRIYPTMLHVANTRPGSRRTEQHSLEDVVTHGRGDYRPEVIYVNPNMSGRPASAGDALHYLDDYESHTHYTNPPDAAHPETQRAPSRSPRPPETPLDAKDDRPESAAETRSMPTPTTESGNVAAAPQQTRSKSESFLYKSRESVKRTPQRQQQTPQQSSQKSLRREGVMIELVDVMVQAGGVHITVASAMSKGMFVEQVRKYERPKIMKVAEDKVYGSDARGTQRTSSGRMAERAVQTEEECFCMLAELEARSNTPPTSCCGCRKPKCKFTRNKPKNKRQPENKRGCQTCSSEHECLHQLSVLKPTPKPNENLKDDDKQDMHEEKENIQDEIELMSSAETTRSATSEQTIEATIDEESCISRDVEESYISRDIEGDNDTLPLPVTWKYVPETYLNESCQCRDKKENETKTAQEQYETQTQTSSTPVSRTITETHDRTELSSDKVTEGETIPVITSNMQYTCTVPVCPCKETEVSIISLKTEETTTVTEPDCPCLKKADNPQPIIETTHLCTDTCTCFKKPENEKESAEPTPKSTVKSPCLKESDDLKPTIHPTQRTEVKGLCTKKSDDSEKNAVSSTDADSCSCSGTLEESTTSINQPEKSHFVDIEDTKRTIACVTCHPLDKTSPTQPLETDVETTNQCEWAQLDTNKNANGQVANQHFTLNESSPETITTIQITQKIQLQQTANKSLSESSVKHQSNTVFLLDGADKMANNNLDAQTQTETERTHESQDSICRPKKIVSFSDLDDGSPGSLKMHESKLHKTTNANLNECCNCGKNVDNSDQHMDAKIYSDKSKSVNTQATSKAGTPQTPNTKCCGFKKCKKQKSKKENKENSTAVHRMEPTKSTQTDPTQECKCTDKQPESETNKKVVTEDDHISEANEEEVETIDVETSHETVNKECKCNIPTLQKEDCQCPCCQSKRTPRSCVSEVPEDWRNLELPPSPSSKGTSSRSQATNISTSTQGRRHQQGQMFSSHSSQPTPVSVSNVVNSKSAQRSHPTSQQISSITKDTTRSTKIQSHVEQNSSLSRGSNRFSNVSHTKSNASKTSSKEIPNQSKLTANYTTSAYSSPGVVTNINKSSKPSKKQSNGSQKLGVEAVSHPSPPSVEVDALSHSSMASTEVNEVSNLSTPSTEVDTLSHPSPPSTDVDTLSQPPTPLTEVDALSHSSTASTEVDVVEALSHPSTAVVESDALPTAIQPKSTGRKHEVTARSQQAQNEQDVEDLLMELDQIEKSYSQTSTSNHTTLEEQSPEPVQEQPDTIHDDSEIATETSETENDTVDEHDENLAVGRRGSQEPQSKVRKSPRKVSPKIPTKQMRATRTLKTTRVKDRYISSYGGVFPVARDAAPMAHSPCDVPRRPAVRRAESPPCWQQHRHPCPPRQCFTTPSSATNFDDIPVRGLVVPPPTCAVHRPAGSCPGQCTHTSPVPHDEIPVRGLPTTEYFFAPSARVCQRCGRVHDPGTPRSHVTVPLVCPNFHVIDTVTVNLTPDRPAYFSTPSRSLPPLPPPPESYNRCTPTPTPYVIPPDNTCAPIVCHETLRRQPLVPNTPVMKSPAYFMLGRGNVTQTFIEHQNCGQFNQTQQEYSFPKIQELDNEDKDEAVGYDGNENTYLSPSDLHNAIDRELRNMAANLFGSEWTEREVGRHLSVQQTPPRLSVYEREVETTTMTDSVSSVGRPRYEEVNLVAVPHSPPHSATREKVMPFPVSVAMVPVEQPGGSSTARGAEATRGGPTRLRPKRPDETSKRLEDRTKRWFS